MGALHIHRSNRVEELAEQLASQLRHPAGTVFVPEAVVVQGRGMSVWLTRELSRRLGVWATELPYPRHFVEGVAETVLGPDALGDPPISEDLIEWAVQSVLDDTMLAKPAFKRLNDYVKRDDRGVRRAQLASHVATVFDQYLVYRPDWIRDWEAGKKTSLPDDHAWQPVLWRAVHERLERPHIAGIEKTLVERLARPDAPAGLPPRVSLFGIASLPPLYVRVLAALSRHVDVHLFLFSPSKAAWPKPQHQPGKRRLQVDNPLLSSLGFLGADFDVVLSEQLAAAGVKPTPGDHHVRPSADGLLGRLQADIHAGADPAKAPRIGLPAAANGDSITIHSCHGPLREVEVLHDQILDLVARQPDPVEPHEIVVLCPDLETYAPLVDAVFARQFGRRRFLPYQITDRASTSSAVVDALSRVLRMADARVTVTEVMDLLVIDAVRERFDIDASEIDSVQGWVAESGARWGIDADHRARRGLPANVDFTWDFGFRRLFLGYAMRLDDRALFGGVVPFDDIEGQEALALGRFVRFARTLFACLKDIEQPRTLPEWSKTIADVADCLFDDDEKTQRQLAAIRQALQAVSSAAETAGFDAAVSLAVMRDVLERKVAVPQEKRGLIGAGITFSAMLPLRGIPFRVVCLLGMNDGVFPRSLRPVEFDAIRTGAGRQPGDRSPRDDDRYLFLETLCAARERLIVTYTGKGVRDNRERPPSVCLGELLDVLVVRYDPPDPVEGDEQKRRDAVVKRLVVPHRLQGFAPEYFKDTPDRDRRLFSYSKEYRTAAEAVMQKREVAGSFVDGAIAPAETAEIRLDDLVRFFVSPAAFFLNRRLGLHLKDYDVEPGDREALEFGHLDDWQLGTVLMEDRLEDVSLDQSEALLRGEAMLPVGRCGRLTVDGVNEVAEVIATETRKHRAGPARPPVNVDVDVAGGLTLVGSVDGMYEGGLVEHSFSKLERKRLIPTWIRHVALCAQGGEARATLIGRSSNVSGVEVRRWAPLPRKTANDILTVLTERFVEGQTAPLEFAPAASWEYFKCKDAPDAMSRAAKKYANEEHGGDTAYDPHFERAFAPLVPPFDREYDARKRNAAETRFHQIACDVYGPLEENFEAKAAPKVAIAATAAPDAAAKGGTTTKKRGRKK